MHYYRHRTMCDVLEDMRKCDSTKNYASLLSLIEEVQIMGNKMEAGLGYKKSIEDMHEECKRLDKKLKEKKKELEAVEGAKKDAVDEIPF